MKNIVCKIMGHDVNRSLVIANQIKHPSQPKFLIQCKRCKFILDKEEKEDDSKKKQKDA